MTGALARVHLETGVLVVGSGAAGMIAALAAAESGSDVLLVDRSLIGRGGATVMAQMTVAAALGDEEPDSLDAHLADTLASGRGLCDPALARIVCADGPDAIRRMGAWGVGWARHPDGRLCQVHAPGHDRRRCVYVDFLATGPAVSKTLRAQVQRRDRVRRLGDFYVTDLVVGEGGATGAVGFSVADGRTVSIAARAIVVATGGLTRLYERNSASANMNGDGYALALRAGAELVDMEFVQFFPIGHLAPRLVGMDPILWDPFRYKLGGRLLNGEGREFMADYGESDAGYVVTRDRATYGILKEVQAGRGSPAGGVYLSFEHVAPDRLRRAFGPVIDRLAANGIDLARRPVEVAPIAHYHMGGIRVGASLETRVANLFAAGEAVGGANGANRLSGNAVTEALVFGRRAGEAAARRARDAAAGWREADAEAALARADAEAAVDGFNGAAAIAALQHLMADGVGPLRSAVGLASALDGIARLRARMPPAPPAGGSFAAGRIDWFDLATMLLVAETVARAALRRTESRGAHQREDHPHLGDDWAASQTVRLDGDAIVVAAGDAA